MTWHSKVVWTEGMFLQPQHFQQHDRFVEWQLRSQMASRVPYGWGFTSLTLDEASAAIGKLALTQARGVLPDGTPFSLPANEPAPAALDIPTDARNELVVLAAVLQRPGLAETDAEEPAASPGPRYRVTEVQTADNNASATRDAPLQVGRLNLRLMLARDSGEAFATLGVARISERLADNKVLLDTSYVPPLLHAAAHPVLDAYLRELHGLLHQRAEQLAGRLSAPGRAGVGEISDFLLLQTVNRNEPLFAHLRRLSLLHPERFYSICLALAGELSTFIAPRRAGEYPEYVHDDLAGCFRPLMDKLRQSLGDIGVPTAVPIELQVHQHNYRVARIPDVQLLRTGAFVLAATAQMSGEALRARIPGQVKVGSTGHIVEMVAHALPGVPLVPMQVAPRQIPFHAGFNYFELDIRRSDEWKLIEASGQLALHVAGDFPGLELEFWGIRAS